MLLIYTALVYPSLMARSLHAPRILGTTTRRADLIVNHILNQYLWLYSAFALTRLKLGVAERGLIMPNTGDVRWRSTGHV